MIYLLLSLQDQLHELIAVQGMVNRQLLNLDLEFHGRFDLCVA